MTKDLSKRPNPEAATPPRQFDPRGVSTRVGGSSTTLLVVLALGATVLVATSTFVNLESDDLVDLSVSAFLSPAYLIPAALLAAAALLSRRRLRVRLDVDSSAVVWTRSLFVPYRSRRDLIDLSAVREICLRSEAYEGPSIVSGPGTSSTTVRVSWIVSLEGASPPARCRSSDYSWARRVAEHFAFSLEVPLRLAEDDVRAPEDIYTPLRDRLARRLLPAAAPLPAAQGRLRADYDAAAGTTRVVLPRVGVGQAIVIDAGCLLFVITMIATTVAAAVGFLAGPTGFMISAVIATAVATAVAWFRSRASEVVTVLADGGLEVVRRFPIGRQTWRVAGDKLDDLADFTDHHDQSAILARSRRRSVLFGERLDADERQWIESVLRLAVARGSVGAV